MVLLSHAWLNFHGEFDSTWLLDTVGFYLCFTFPSSTFKTWNTFSWNMLKPDFFKYQSWECHSWKTRGLGLNQISEESRDFMPKFAFNQTWETEVGTCVWRPSRKLLLRRSLTRDGYGSRYWVAQIYGPLRLLRSLTPSKVSLKDQTFSHWLIGHPFDNHRDMYEKVMFTVESHTYITNHVPKLDFNGKTTEFLRTLCWPVSAVSMFGWFCFENRFVLRTGCTPVQPVSM